MTSLRTLASHAKRVWPALRKGQIRVGWCPICERRVLFFVDPAGSSLRDQLRCVRCKSIPRFRALVHVLGQAAPRWRELLVHESSPGGASSQKLARECGGYSASHFFPDVPLGGTRGAFRCERLEALTFADATFDVFVTQDVFEHVLDPARGFAEVMRVLRPGGVHVFTVPIHRGRQTLVRVVPDPSSPDGMRHLLPKDFHGNPIDEEGALVIREWGDDLVGFIREATGVQPVVHDLHDPRMGLEGHMLEVIELRKP